MRINLASLGLNKLFEMLNLLLTSSKSPLVEMGAWVGATNTRGDIAMQLLTWRDSVRGILVRAAPHDLGATISPLSEGVKLLLSESCCL